MLKEIVLNSTNNGQYDDLALEDLKGYIFNRTNKEDERTELADGEDEEDDKETLELGDEEDFDDDEALEERDDD